MAEKVIGLRLQINGVPQTISNIKQLEEEISKLEGKLKTTEIGSAEFSNLSNEIRTARGQLEDFNKSTEGFGFEKLVESVGKFAAGVTGGFAAATAAVQLFGGDSEEVNKAAQKAQNLLTIAIGATTIAEGVLAAKKLFSTKATVAKTAATVVTTTATVGQTAATVALTGAEVGAAAATGVLTTAIKVLGNAIKTNPLLFIVGILVAAASAMSFFTDDTEDAEKAVAKLDAALKKSISTLDELSRKNQNQYKKDLANAEAAGKSIEELFEIREKIANEEIKLNEEKIKKLDEAIAEEIKLLEKRNLSEEKNLEEREKINEKYGSQKQTAIIARDNAEVNLEIDKINTKKQLQEREAEIIKINSSNQVAAMRDGLNKELAIIKLAYDDQIKEAIKKGAKTNDITKKYENDKFEIIKKFNLAYRQSVNDLYVELNQLTIGSFLLEEKSLKDAQKKRKEEFEKTQKENNIAISKNLIKSLASQEQIRKTYESNLTKLISQEEDIRQKIAITTIQTENEVKKQLFDDYLKQELIMYTDNITKEITLYDKWGGVVKKNSEMQVILNKKTNEKIKVNTEKLTDELENIKLKKEELFNTKKVELDKIQTKNATAVQIEAAQARLDLETLFAAQIQDLKLRKELEGLQVNLDLLKQANRDTIEEQKKLYEKDFDLKVENDKKKIRAGAEVSAILSGEKDTQKIKAAGDEAVASYLKLAASVKLAGLTSIEEQNKLNEKLIDAELKYNLQREQLVKDFALKEGMTENQRLKNQTLLNAALLKAQQEYEKEKLSIEKKALEDKLKLLEKDPTIDPKKIKEIKTAIAKINFDFAMIENEGVEKAAAAAREARELQVKEILQGLEIFTQVLSKVGDLAAQNFSLQLEKSENRYNQTLERIGEDAKRVDGETQEDFLKRQELINEKRIEAEKIYNAEKKAIEKRARLTSLKIQLASSLADVAASIIKSYVQYGFTPAGIAAAALAATFGGIQIGIIGKTINEVNSMARGGFLRGPSHEQGGIKYQGGGVEVEGNESVINRRSTLAYAPLLSQINMQGGGRPIYVNNVMDSRMAEVLASVKNEPIRAYVLEQDITKSQAVNRRLEELASY